MTRLLIMDNTWSRILLTLGDNYLQLLRIFMKYIMHLNMDVLSD